MHFSITKTIFYSPITHNHTIISLIILTTLIYLFIIMKHHLNIKPTSVLGVWSPRHSFPDAWVIVYRRKMYLNMWALYYKAPRCSGMPKNYSKYAWECCFRAPPLWHFFRNEFFPFCNFFNIRWRPKRSPNFTKF